MTTDRKTTDRKTADRMTTDRKTTDRKTTYKQRYKQHTDRNILKRDKMSAE